MDPTTATTASTLPPEALALASRMYDAARAGQTDIFEQALPAGLPANMTNEKGDSLVCLTFPAHYYFNSYSLCLRSFPVSFRSQLKGSTDSEKVMLAAYYGHAPLVKLLISHGGNPNSLNDRGQSPLAGAVFKKEDEVIEVHQPQSYRGYQTDACIRHC